MTFTVGDAVALATDAHAGAADKGGKPYIQHVLRVMEMVAAAGYDEHIQIAAALHDTVEDTSWTLAALLAHGVPARSVEMVDAVTRRTGPQYPNGKEPYQKGLIARAAAHDGGRVIKLFDNAHNSLPRRRALLPPGTPDLEPGRYRPARIALLRAEATRRAQGLAGAFPTDPDEFLAYAVALDQHLEASATG